MEKKLIIKLNEALIFIESAYDDLNYFIQNENKLNDAERHKYYSYGRDTLRLNVVRLASIKKTIASIIGNKGKSKKKVSNDETDSESIFK